MNIEQNDADDEINLSQVFHTLWKGWTWIAVLSILGFVSGLLMIANTQPTFQADALLQLEERSGALTLPSSLSGMLENDPRSVTEIEILRSRMVLGNAIAEQDLDLRVTPDLMAIFGTLVARYRLPFFDSIIPARFMRPGESITLESLVVPPGLLNQEIELIVTGATEYIVVMPDGKTLTGVVGRATMIEEDGFSLTISDINAPAERRFYLRQLDEVRAINALRSRLSVSERGRSSGVLEVRLSGEDPQGTSRALNAIIQAYLGQNVSRGAAEAESSLTFIRDQLPQAERNLRDAEAALNAYQQKQVTVDLAMETQTVLEQITRIEKELEDVQRREDSFGDLFTPKHPIYRQLQDERGRLDTRLAALREQVSALPETQRQILNLTRSIDLSQRIFTELLIRAQEVEVLRASSVGNVRIVDGARASPDPIAPRRSRILALSLAMGAIAAIGAVLLRSLMKKGIEASSELEKLGLLPFATINYSKEADTKGRRLEKMKILALENSADPAVEAIRSLRTSLHFGMLDAKTPSICMTSSHKSAGKSFLSVNLAAVVAQAGQRVCLVDADLRRGQMHRYFNVPSNSPGLAEVLAGAISLEKAIIHCPIKNLFFLPVGHYPPNPSELLMRADLPQMIDWCAKQFDLTIFDTPPILAVTDPVILARNTGATIFVARHGVTPVGEIAAAQKTLASAGLKFSGAVLNAFDPKKAGSRYEYGYHYEY